MAIVIAALTFVAAYGACLALTLAVRPRALGLAGPLAAALLVCFEAVSLRGLSAFGWATRPGVLIAHIVLLGTAWAVLSIRKVKVPKPRLLSGDPSPLVWVAGPGLLAFVAAVGYRPNNGDSMTYHLARVVYWLQNHSVAAYPTNIMRQVVFPPGAEYLLFVVQVISGSDRLANLVQFGAWLILAGAAPPLARLFGADRRVAPWAALLVAAAPMAVVQASSTQNDLIAAVLALAMVIAMLPFLHVRDHWRSGDLALLLVAVTAGLLVKPTSVVCATPFLGWGLIVAVRGVRARDLGLRLIKAAPVAAVCLVLACGALGPLLLSRQAERLDPVAMGPFVYSGVRELPDRIKNVARGVLRNLPVPLPLFDALAPEHTFGCDKPFSLCLRPNLMLFNDDTAMNPAQLLFLLVAGTLGLIDRRSLSRRSRIALLGLLGSWLLFHAVFRDNLVLTRLQLPLFALAAVALGAFTPRWLARPTGAAIWRVLLTGAAATAALAVVLNGRRPLNPVSLSEGLSDGAYYNLVAAAERTSHGDALRVLEQTDCDRLGLFLKETSFDYPLAWRAYQRGIEVRHVVGPDDWPCAVYSARGVPPPRPDGLAWLPSSAPSLYFRAGFLSDKGS